MLSRLPFGFSPYLRDILNISTTSQPWTAAGHATGSAAAPSGSSETATASSKLQGKVLARQTNVHISCSLGQPFVLPRLLLMARLAGAHASVLTV